MRTITVNKENLRVKVQENRAGHRDKFERAMERYRIRMVEELEARIDEIKNNKQVDHMIRLPVPEDHTSDYDRVLAMLDWELGDTIELDESDVENYIRDSWSWTKVFAQTSAGYGIK